jgi:hypothetical protein
MTRSALARLILLFLIFVTSSCTLALSEQTAMSAPTTTIRHPASPSATPTLPHTLVLVNTRQALSGQDLTKTPIPTLTPIPTTTEIYISDPRIKELENKGYTREDLEDFRITAEGETTLFGRPDSEPTLPQLVYGPYAYFQYIHELPRHCILVFAAAKDGQYSLLSMIDVSELNERLKELFNPDSYLYYDAILFCNPLGWGDFNRNGKPDMSVSLMWADHYGGSEVHIFEVVDESTVVDLVKDLPGIISPWSFDPSQTRQTVFDLAWAGHDCIYPPMAVAWIYDWRDGKFADITSEIDSTEYIDSLRETIQKGFGSEFNAIENIKPLTRLLLAYDRSGRRDQGWQEYLDLTDMSHYPDTPAFDADWLKSDVEHFAGEYKQGLPFTPNDYCNWALPDYPYPINF